MRKIKGWVSKSEEKTLPELVQKELKYLRKRVQEQSSEIEYLTYINFGDEPPENLSRKFGRKYDN